ncbi:archaetidylserine decarboxylase [Polycyclovorans algicola]|uniref:archaetidylserine decarboxylase n=1 Tax=Polycyclovorans algicola TaxID=616992 RepID=UPI000A997A3B|nr:archaetidylserine decarboxylase [Polycyclovorans algicola]
MSDLTLAGASLAARCFVGLQLVLPTRALSRLVHSLTRVRWTPFKNGLIHAFIRGFNISLAEAEIERVEDFEHFNAFFTRALKPGERALAPAPAFISPVDGRISQHGPLNDGQLVQAKGHHYAVEALLGNTDWAQTFKGGDFATIYLAPYNYHRIHMPVAGQLRAWRYIPGRLFSVNGMTASAMPDLFTRNERLVALFDTEHGAMAMVLVGALFVGGIETVWSGAVTPPHQRGAPGPIITPPTPVHLARGAEMGRFNMGSTVVVVTAAGMTRPTAGVSEDGRIRLGQPISMLC